MPDEPLANAEVNLFRHSYDPRPAQTLTLMQALEAIRTGTYQRQVGRVRELLARRGKPAYDRAKQNLPAFTFGGTFTPTRALGHLQHHSGIVHGDLDHLIDVVDTKHAMCSDPRTVYAFVSPSSEGLKLGVRVPIVSDDAAYKHAWQAVSQAYEATYRGQWDPSGKDISRLCFVSYDPAAYWNPRPEVFEVPPMAPPTPRERPAPITLTRLEDTRDYAARAIATAVLMIESAELGTRHHARLRAARLLGGYIAGGLLTDDQAYGALAQALVGHTDDLNGALKTVEDGLAYGKAHPITLEDLEDERHAWLQAHRASVPKKDHHPLDENPWAGMQTVILPSRTRSPSLRSRQFWMPKRGTSHG
jgi:hypothetical protein